MPEPGVSRRNLHEHLGLFAIAPRAEHLVEQVVAGEAGDEGPRLVQGQLLDDVAAHGVGGRGRQGDGRGVAQHAAEIAQPGVIGAEIVAPLADAVGLVDRQQFQAHRPHRFQKPRAAEPLRHDVDQAELARRHAIEPVVLLGDGQRAIDERDRKPAGLELIDLVLHQGDQRRDHQRQPVERQGRQLVAEALAAAGGHDAQAVLARQDGGNDFPLAGAEGRQAEPRQEGIEIIAGNAHAGIIEAFRGGMKWLWSARRWAPCAAWSPPLFNARGVEIPAGS